MNSPTRSQGQREADGSILDDIPTPEEIRQEMAKNAERNRVLRSLYRLSRRLCDRKRQAAEDRQGVANEVRQPQEKSRQELRFQELRDRWKRETMHLSRMDKICTNSWYLQIIGLGSEALPLILEELSESTDYWFTALESITGIRSDELSSAGTVDAVKDAWVAWGKRHGHIE